MGRRRRTAFKSSHTTDHVGANPRQIAKQVQVLFEPGSVVELRVPGTRRGTVSGYFTNLRKLAANAAEWSGEADGVYVTLNPVKPALLARSANRLTEYAKQTTSDTDITTRRWLPIDLDPVRPAGISSTDQEHTWALERRATIRSFLHDFGWPDPVVADSGNGAHVLYRIELPNDDASRILVQRCLEALDLQFSDERVQVDQTTSNAAR